MALDALLGRAGLASFAEKLRSFGIESIDDLGDQRLITDDDLRSSEIGMGKAHVRKLRLELAAAAPTDAPQRDLLAAPSPPRASSSPTSPPSSPPRAGRAEPPPPTDEIEELDDAEVPNVWRLTAAACREARHADDFSPFKLTYAKGKGGTMPNAHLDVTVSCLVPGCVAGRNGVKNSGVSKSGGGSAKGCSLKNFQKHRGTEGHLLNVAEYRRRRATRDLGSTSVHDARPRAAGRAAEPTLAAADAVLQAPQRPLQEEPRDRMEQLVDEGFCHEFTFNLGHRLAKCRSCEDWTTDLMGPRVRYLLNDHLTHAYHQLARSAREDAAAAADDGQGTLLRHLEPFAMPKR